MNNNAQTTQAKVCQDAFRGSVAPCAPVADEDPKVLAIHAGLECGIIGEKFPGMDMISFGPTIKGAHSPDERIHIESTQKFWDFLIELLKRTPDA